MRISRRLGPVFAVLPVVLLASGCGSDSDSGSTAVDPTPLTLKVESQGWTGWQEQQPEPELDTDDSLIVTNPGGGIDFDEATTHFTLDRDEPLTLGTPTMDAGTTITLTVE